MININSIQDCCLCGACKDVCPKSAIAFTNRQHTFDYPIVDKDKCVACGLCEKVCPELNQIEEQNPISSFAAYSNDDNVKANSTSGGIFFELAKRIIHDGGVVFGAAFDSSFHVKHIMVDRVEEIGKLCGSKYVQSDMSGCYSQIQNSIKNGQTVLFSGCPCQCAGVYHFFNKKEREYIYLVDFICHGIQSDLLFQCYISYLERKYRSKVTDFKFRSKEKFGWEKSEVKITFSDGTRVSCPYYEDPYVKGMLQGISCKEACYSCSFKGFRSGSDITLGDYWGVKESDSEAFDAMGTSIISVQSEKGMRLIQSLEGIALFDRPIERLTAKNKGLFVPFGRGKKYENYWDKMTSSSNPFELLNKTVSLSAKERIISNVRRIRNHLKGKNKHE